ncbi:MAG: hypothetical protein VXY16_08475 [Pseudomonadota bacterium]|nr:hypothetical protein [Pseudomonadota bacterium]
MKNTMTSKIELPVQAEEGFETKAWVVFTGQTDRPWLRFLRPGFRHCFVLLNDGRQWMSFDPMLNHIEVKIQHSVNADFDLPNWLAGRGYTVVNAPIDHSNKIPAPWRFFTCVEAIKRVLGLHARTIFTPWQLYKHLTNFETQGELSWEV